MNNQKSLSSKNYEEVHVYVRNNVEPYVLKPLGGTRLMSYLTGKDVGSFVRINDITGSEVVIRTNEILKVEPVIKKVKVTDEELERLIA